MSDNKEILSFDCKFWMETDERYYDVSRLQMTKENGGNAYYLIKAFKNETVIFNVCKAVSV